VITGVARAIERAVLETTLGVGGAAIVVLGQGIARAQPGMRRLQAHIAGATLLVLAALTPEAPWQPGLEEGRGALAASLAERVAVAQMGEGEGIAAAVQAACRLRRPVFVREADAEAHRALLPDGALALPWPAEPGELAALLLPPSRRRLREGPGQDAAGDEVPREARAAEQPDQRPGAEALAPAAGSVEPDGKINEHRLDEELLRYLRRSRRKATGKGALLQAFPVDESALDRALLALIAAGQVVERSHRSGARYAAVRAGDEEAMRSGFQLSLFGQDDPG
jgi:predicted Rossmann fold nucleotide-binding protein DprA/Smf involved in DNA uptake